MKLPLIIIARISGIPWWKPNGWMLLTPAEWELIRR